MKRKIITDTNIWYEIDSDTVKKISSEFQLVIPIIVLNELGTSPNLWRSQESFEKLQKAVLTIIENRSDLNFIELDPFEYLLQDILPNIKPRLSLQMYFDELNALTKLNYNQVKDFRPERHDISGFTNFINVRSVSYKKMIDSDRGKFKRTNTLPYIEKYILMLANDNLTEINGSYPKIEELNKEKFELLINTFNEIFREVSRSTMKMEDNDWIDIFNMTYVAKADLYWTKEKSILRQIKSAGYENYLFS